MTKSRTIGRARILWTLAVGLWAPLTAEDGKTIHWPSFRGPAARGWDDTHATPTSWDVEKGRNVDWKTSVPGLGLSSPVIWGDRLFVTTAISSKGEAKLKVGLYGDISPAKDDSKHRYVLVCLDRASGEVLWRKTACEGVPTIKRHTKSSHANSTPATDGRRVVALFGSEGLYCYDVDGELLWKKDLGRLDSGYYVAPRAQWGFGSSPVIRDDRVIVQCDVQKNSFVAAFALEDGKRIWRTPRKEIPGWGTPAVVVHDGKAQVVVNGHLHIGAYDFETGAEIWRLRGGGDIPVPTPIVWKDLVFITNAHGSLAPIYAIRLGARGKIDLNSKPWKHEHLAWGERRGGNYMQTPIVYRDLLYCCRDNGVLTCYEPDSGDQLFRKRLGGGRSGFTASPVAADGKIYYTSEDGDVHVVRAGRSFEVLGTSSLGEVAMATPAIAGGKLFFRTRGHVVCIGNAAAKK